MFACKASEVPPGALKLVHVSDMDVLMANVAGKFYAMENWCTHEQGDLSQGELKKNVVTCPEHGAQFDVTSGRVLVGADGDSPESIQPEKVCKVTVQGDNLMIELS